MSDKSIQSAERSTNEINAERLTRDVQAFLDKGGKITEIARGQSGNAPPEKTQTAEENRNRIRKKSWDIRTKDSHLGEEASEP